MYREFSFCDFIIIIVWLPGLHCGAWAFSSYGSQGLPSRLSTCICLAGSHGLGCPHHVGSYFPVRDQTQIPCTGRRILNHCTTREIPDFLHLGVECSLVSACPWLLYPFPKLDFPFCSEFILVPWNMVCLLQATSWYKTEKLFAHSSCSSVYLFKNHWKPFLTTVLYKEHTTLYCPLWLWIFSSSPCIKPSIR